MRIIIIEDELLAQEKLESMLQILDPGITVVAKLASVRETLSWLRQNEPPDLAFVDIQLSDNHSFEIFKVYTPSFPIIFTTAYDKFILESFDHNTIDYLLKPITAERLSKALRKVRELERHFLTASLTKWIGNLPLEKSHRIIAKKGQDNLVIDLSHVAYFFIEHKVVFVTQFDGTKNIVEKSLSDLESELKPHRFFRINRKFLCHPASIKQYRSDNGKLVIQLNPPTKSPIIASKEVAPEFRKWIDS